MSTSGNEECGDSFSFVLELSSVVVPQPGSSMRTGLAQTLLEAAGAVTPPAVSDRADAAVELLRRLPHTDTKTESSVVGQFGLGGAGKTDEPVIVVAHSRAS